MKAWQLQEAKNRFSRVVDEALSQGPQMITRRGVEAVVVLSYTDYRKLQGLQKRLSEFFRQSPMMGTDIDLRRDKSDVRPDIEL